MNGRKGIVALNRQHRVEYMTRKKLKKARDAFLRNILVDEVG